MRVSGTLVPFTVDPWDPAYGQAFSDEHGGTLDDSTAELVLDLEVAAVDWRPIDPDRAPALPRLVLFLDGVRRIDARVWVHASPGQPAMGIAASLAAGVVACDGAARIVDVAIERGLFTAAREAAGITTRAATYPLRLAAGPGYDKLSLALQQRLSALEVELALAARETRPAGDDLLVVDGPLHGRVHLDRTVGYIKTHHASYLPSPQAAVVGALRPGQRTPAFTMGTSWRRNSWYLQLPQRGIPGGTAAELTGGSGAPWAGVVRVECSADLKADQVTRLADLTARMLPPLASAPHKDPRAPQNLVPIGGLERELRGRLGDQQLLYRALRSAAVTGSADRPAG
ncbi:MAG: hypothetical protein ACTHJW_20725 [Streptosporangiaceae bacterium]